MENNFIYKQVRNNTNKAVVDTVLHHKSTSVLMGEMPNVGNC